MDFTIIIPFRNGHAHISKLVASLPSGIPVIIVDDVSDKTLYVDSENASIQVIRRDSRGFFSGAVNTGIKACSNDVLILNQDVWFEGTEWLNVLEENLSNDVAIIGESIKGHHPAWINGYIHGTFCYITRRAIDKVGLFNVTDYPLWGSTCEWQLRACRKGFKVVPVKIIAGMFHDRKPNERYGSSIKELLRIDPTKKDLYVRIPPEISVVIPCHNYGRYLEDAVNSLIGGNTSLGYLPGQTFQSFEIVIVDDHSTDDTEEVCKNLVDPWKAIHYHKTPANLGSAGAMNYGIARSHGKFIARIDADDMREPESIEQLYRTLIKNPKSFVYDDVTIFTKNGKNPKVWKIGEYDFEAIIHKNNIHAGIMFPYQAWKDAGGYPEVMTKGREDWAFNIALGIKGYCGVHVPYAGYLYRRQGQNRTLTNTTPKHREMFLKQLRQAFPEIYQGVRPMGCCGGRSKGSKGVETVKKNVYATDPDATMLVGSEGTILVQYEGDSIGRQTFYGPATGTAYVFSTHRRFGRIDVRDAHYQGQMGRKFGLLDLTEGRERLFSEYSLPEPVAEAVKEPEPLPEPEPEPEPVDFLSMLGDDIASELKAVGIASVEDIISTTNKDLKATLEWTASEVKELKDEAKNYVAGRNS